MTEINYQQILVEYAGNVNIFHIVYLKLKCGYYRAALFQNKPTQEPGQCCLRHEEPEEDQGLKVRLNH